MEHADRQRLPHGGTELGHRVGPVTARAQKGRSWARPYREPTGPLGRYWAVAVYGWLVVAISAVSAPVPLRAFAVFSFVLVGPGIPIVGLVRHREPLEHLVLSVMVSMSLATLLAEGMALLGWWSTVGGLAMLAGATTIAAVLQGTQERAIPALSPRGSPDTITWVVQEPSAEGRPS